VAPSSPRTPCGVTWTGRRVAAAGRTGRRVGRLHGRVGGGPQPHTRRGAHTCPDWPQPSPTRPDARRGRRAGGSHGRTGRAPPLTRVEAPGSVRCRVGRGVHNRGDVGPTSPAADGRTGAGYPALRRQRSLTVHRLTGHPVRGRSEDGLLMASRHQVEPWPAPYANVVDAAGATAARGPLRLGRGGWATASGVARVEGTNEQTVGRPVAHRLVRTFFHRKPICDGYSMKPFDGDRWDWMTPSMENHRDRCGHPQLTTRVYARSGGS